MSAKRIKIARKLQQLDRMLKPDPPWTPFERASLWIASPLAPGGKRKLTDEEAGGKCFKNSRYTVIVRQLPELTRPRQNFPDLVDTIWPALTHLSIKRNDKQPIRDWRDMQRIKNELVGEMNEGVELYPAEDRLVDGANQFHLWVFTQAGERFPFGFEGRLVTGANGGVKVPGAVQRPMDIYEPEQDDIYQAPREEPNIPEPMPPAAEEAMRERLQTKRWLRYASFLCSAAKCGEEIDNVDTLEKFEALNGPAV